MIFSVKKPIVFMPIGMLCLVLGLLSPMLYHPASEAAREWLHGITGFFLGLSITFNLAAFVLTSRARRSRES